MSKVARGTLALRTRLGHEEAFALLMNPNLLGQGDTHLNKWLLTTSPSRARHPQSPLYKVQDTTGSLRFRSHAEYFD